MRVRRTVQRLLEATFVAVRGVPGVLFGIVVGSRLVPVVPFTAVNDA